MSEKPHFIPLSIPEIGGREWDYVKDCLDTGWVSSVGAYVDRFEEALAARVDMPFAVATVNGTAALHIALQVAGVGPGDRVLVSDVTFIAPVNAIRYVGAEPVFLDAEDTYAQMDLASMQRYIDGCSSRAGTLYDPDGHPVKAIIPVHVLGHPLDIDPVIALAREHGLVVIEDASEALGARYRDRPCGSFGDLACFSFNGNKLITCGGGGMLVTAREDWAKRARHLTTQAKCDPIEYEHDEVGYNYRLTNVLAALGLAQLERLDDYVARKRAIATRYNEGLAGLPGLTTMPEADWAYSTYWMYTVRIDAERFGMDSRALLEQLQGQGIQTRPLWKPAHANRPYLDRPAQSPVAERWWREGLSLPCSVGLAEAEQARVIDALRAAAAS